MVHVHYCTVCGVRVTEEDIRNGRGIERNGEVWCAKHASQAGEAATTPISSRKAQLKTRNTTKSRGAIAPHRKNKMLKTHKPGMTRIIILLAAVALVVLIVIISLYHQSEPVLEPAAADGKPASLPSRPHKQKQSLKPPPESNTSVAKMRPRKSVHPINVKVNFQPTFIHWRRDSIPIPGDYLTDYGEVYDKSRGYGWNADNTKTARERQSVPDKRLDTFVHMQKEGSYTWEYSLPPGRYKVTVAVGEALYLDSVNRIEAEGVAIIKGFIPTEKKKFLVAEGTVTVSDGKLTIQPGRGANTKICYIIITSADNDKSVTTSSAARPVTKDRKIPAGKCRIIMPAADTFVEKLQRTAQNFGRETQLAIEGNREFCEHWMLLRFDLPALPPDTEITKAELLLYCKKITSPLAGGWIRVFGIKKSWTENDATFISSDGKQLWDGGGFDSPGNVDDKETTYLVYQSPVRQDQESKNPHHKPGPPPDGHDWDEHYICFDVTNLVLDWVNGRRPNYGMAVSAISKTPYPRPPFYETYQYFMMRVMTRETGHSPKLKVYYRLNGGN